MSPRDANRMWSYRDVNADVGGFIKKDAVWWYSSFRDQDVSTRFVNFPVEPYRTHVTSVTGKTTYRLTDHNKLIAFGQIGRNHQPTRLTPFGPAGGGLSPTTALHLSETATAEQIAWGWIWKGEWNSAISNRLYLEVRAGEFGADRPETPYGTAPRYEDIGSLIVSGGSRDWEESLRREQVLGSLSLFQDGWFGNHLLKIGGEIFRTVSTETWRTSYPQQVLHVLSNGQPVDVYLFEAPSAIRKWDVDADGVCERLVATERPADLEPRAAIRSLSSVSSRTNPCRRTVQPSTDLPRHQQLDRLERRGPPRGRDIRSDRRCPDGREVQRWALLAASGGATRFQRKSELEPMVAAIPVV